MSRNSVAVNTLGFLDTATIVNPALFYIISNFFAGPAFYIRIVNRSNINVFISYGTLAQANAGTLALNDICPSNGEINLSLQSNARPNNNVALMPQGWAIWASAPAAGVGNIYATCYYQTE